MMRIRKKIRKKRTMKRIRPIKVVTCCVCGGAFDKIRMHELFTGRTKYMCPACYAAANRQMDARRSAWKSLSKDERIISEAEKHK